MTSIIFKTGRRFLVLVITEITMSLQSSKEAVDDPLWKSVLEQTFVHFLTFFFPEADKIFDLSKKFVYLDKELQSMFPPKPHNKGVRYVDKLVRVSLVPSPDL